jgi:hypothetical protein
MWPVISRDGNKLQEFEKKKCSEKSICTLNSIEILWHVDALLGNDREVIRQRLLLGNRPQRATEEWCFLRGPPMFAHATMDTATEERYFLCGPCLDVISRTISES